MDLSPFSSFFRPNIRPRPSVSASYSLVLSWYTLKVHHMKGDRKYTSTAKVYLTCKIQERYPTWNVLPCFSLPCEPAVPGLELRKDLQFFFLSFLQNPFFLSIMQFALIRLSVCLCKVLYDTLLIHLPRLIATLVLLNEHFVTFFLLTNRISPLWQPTTWHGGKFKFRYHLHNHLEWRGEIRTSNMEASSPKTIWKFRKYFCLNLEAQTTASSMEVKRTRKFKNALVLNCIFRTLCACHFISFLCTGCETKFCDLFLTICHQFA